jgi:sec-independent protein translocase protein TatA
MGGSEILLILLVALLLFGSNKIPEVARMLGKGLREFHKVTEDIKKEINEGTTELHDSYKGVHKSYKDINKDLKEEPKNKGDNFVI